MRGQSTGVKIVLAGLVLFPGLANAGSYFKTTLCTFASGCLVGHPLGEPQNNVNPQSIVHPTTFVQGATDLTVRICTNALPATGIPAALEEAVSRWNSSVPTTENCFRCRTWEEGPPGPGPRPVLFDTLFHELGHCALGLGHPNILWNADGNPGSEDTSYTMSWNNEDIMDGGDGIPGSYNDIHDGIGGGLAQNVHWFRIQDNNPVIIDTQTTIDVNTYSRSVAAHLPPDNWAANANRRVGESLGHPMTQTPMYSAYTVGSFTTGLAADDVNMLKMARTGPNLMANDADDYTLSLEVVPCSSAREIDIRYVPLSQGVLGDCKAEVYYAYPQNPNLARVFKVVPDPSFDATYVVVRINSNITSWITDIPLFGGDFETGDTSFWSAVQP